MKDFNFKLDIVKTLEQVKSGDRVVVGYASTFDIDSDDTQITREALEGAKDDLRTYSTVLFNHDMDKPIGKVVDTEVDDVGLLVKIIISKEENDIWKKVQEGVITKFSIKGRALEMKAVEGDKILIQQITKIKLFEVSLVSLPANKEAQTISYWIAKSLRKKIVKKTKEAIKDETSSNTNETMNELLEKLKIILSKEKTEDMKDGLKDLVKEMETEDDLLAKLELVAGKLSGEDKDVVDFAVEVLKRKHEKIRHDDDGEFPGPSKSFNFADETDSRPVFQLNGSATEVELDEENKYSKQLLKFGKWYHWDADGGVLNITEEVVDNIVKNFKKGLIEHVYVPLSHTNDPTKNAGEVVKLQKTETGLDAIIEIKDESIVEKIKGGLIKCVSASLDPNYRVKTTNKFVGPTLLHAALVSEPFIKGMTDFVALSEDFKGRQVIQLEDSEPNFFEIMKALKDSLENIENKIITSDQVEEVFAKIHTESNIIKNEADEEEVEESTEEESTEEATEVEKKAHDHQSGDPCQVDGRDGKYVLVGDKLVCKAIVEKAKHAHKPGDPCMVDGKKGTYVTEDDTLVCKVLTEKQIEELQKTAFQTCMSREMKAGKSMAEAAKTCKTKTKKSIEKMYSEASSGEQPEEKSEDTAQHVDFADAERVYEEYLKLGKIVPAQKEAFIKLIASGKSLELGEDKVEISELIKTFMEFQSSSINFEEEGVPEDDKEEKEEAEEGAEKGGADLSEVPSEARNFFSKMGLSEEDTKKSWENMKILKEEDEEESTLFN